jgi:hypothetical protein
MILKRLKGSFSTLVISTGRTRWRFPLTFSFFAVSDKDYNYIVKNGNFTRLQQRELDRVKPQEVHVVERCGPAIPGG